jgi:hypothetical protein
VSVSKRRFLAPALMAFAVISVQCMCPFGPVQLVEDFVPDEELTAEAEREDLGLTQAAVAATQTARAQATPANTPTATPLPPEAHVPGILNIDMPRQVPRDGKPVSGTIIFSDPAHDVSLVAAQVVFATLHANPFSFDPRGDIVWQEDRGITQMDVWCTGDPQTVRFAIRLHDEAGNISAPYQMEYECK